MKKIIFISGLIIMLVPVFMVQSCNSSSAGKMLRFNLGKGKGYDFEIVWSMDQKVMDQDSYISLTSLYNMKVTNDDGHIKELTCSYKSFHMNMKMAGMDIDVDTDKPSPPMTEEEMKQNPMGLANRIFAGIIGKPFVMKVNEEGKVLDVIGFQEILAGMTDSIGLGEEFRAQMAASLQDQFNEQTIKDQFAQVLFIYPNKEVKVGDSWEKSFEMGGKMPAKYTTLYKVKEIAGDNVVLSTNSNISAGGEMTIKGNQTGDVTIDAGSGLMTNAEFDQNIDVSTKQISLKIKGKGRIKGRPE